PTVVANLKDIIEEVREGDFDVGIAFDGDVDRIGVINNEGEIVWADYLLVVFARDILKKRKGKVLFDVKCSQVLEEQIKRSGGEPVMWKTGHSLIKEKMKEVKAILGGEMSGHIFFSDDYYGYDDAIYVACRLVKLLSDTGKKLTQLTSDIPKFFSTPEIRAECPSDEEKFKIAARAKNYFTANYDCITVDGVRIKFGDGWGLVRASNTQPVIVLRFEASTAERLQQIKEIVTSKLRQFGEIKV
ncbi:MAG: phosphomannomutase, partial [Fidelibacterota bacterium]